VSGAWGGDADVVFNAEVMLRQAAELDEELAHVRSSGRSRDGAVTAVVSGSGVLLDLKISDSAGNADTLDSLAHALQTAATYYEQQDAEEYERLKKLEGGTR
jgi:DNA-binding protein YbaB